MSTRLPHRAVLQLLAYSWEDAAFEYEGLTDTERSLITAEEFDDVIRCMVEAGIIGLGLEEVDPLKGLDPFELPEEGS